MTDLARILIETRINAEARELGEAGHRLEEAQRGVRSLEGDIERRVEIINGLKRARDILSDAAEQEKKL